MLTKTQLRKEVLQESLILLKDEGLSHEYIAQARKRLAEVTELPPGSFSHPEVKTLEDARNAIDTVEEFLRHVEAFPCA
jgi:hypothetical protein